MCLGSSSKTAARTPAPQLIAAYDNREAIQQGGIAAWLRRLRAGAAANVLTSPVGIPSASDQLGKVGA